MPKRTRAEIIAELQEVARAMPAYFGAGPSGDMAQDAFDREFDELLRREAELRNELVRTPL